MCKTNNVFPNMFSIWPPPQAGFFHICSPFADLAPRRSFPLILFWIPGESAREARRENCGVCFTWSPWKTRRAKRAEKISAVILHAIDENPSAERRFFIYVLDPRSGVLFSGFSPGSQQQKRSIFTRQQKDANDCGMKLSQT